MRNSMVIRGQRFSLLPRDEIVARLLRMPAKPVKHVYVELQGNRFPIKDALRWVLGVLNFGAADARRYFNAVGLVVGRI